MKGIRKKLQALEQIRPALFGRGILKAVSPGDVSYCSCN